MVKDKIGLRINVEFPEEIIKKIRSEAAEFSIKPGTRLRQIVIEYFRRKEQEAV